MGGTFILVLLAIAVVYAAWSIRVLAQYERGVVFLLGKFEGVRGPGITLIFNPFELMTRVSLRTVTMQIPSQKIITKEPLAKLQRRGELSALNGEFARCPRRDFGRVFPRRITSRIGRGHASADLSIKNLGAHSRQSFPLANGRTWAAHRHAQASGDDA